MTSTEKEKGYNGYTNYETWNCALWLDNDEGTQETVREMAQEAYDHPEANQYMTVERRRVHTLKDSLKAMMEEQAEQWMPDQSSFFADMLNSAVAEVNWYELAENYLEEIEETEEDEA